MPAGWLKIAGSSAILRVAEDYFQRMGYEMKDGSNGCFSLHVPEEGISGFAAFVAACRLTVSRINVDHNTIGGTTTVDKNGGNGGRGSDAQTAQPAYVCKMCNPPVEFTGEHAKQKKAVHVRYHHVETAHRKAVVSAEKVRRRRNKRAETEKATPVSLCLDALRKEMAERDKEIADLEAKLGEAKSKKAKLIKQIKVILGEEA